ncbi:hypothetical protein BED47_18010 [Gottfriedia luciferensis]|uniref:Uncharacterized protein n=1 Tax=Gottfriedia luciferensis TaxID=178774 RepID=A0ABX2ZTT5_9BACI|nr:hypothetical protein [Gottfriedia luciferensis]ODG92812.1 hypothetical protein BED47_18010 [Gottfriedia luciferensis]
MSQVMEVIGAWVNAIGTISSAISSTPMRGLRGENRKRWEDISFHLDFGGNSFQAIGNLIEAFLGEPSVIEDAGEIIQASGNVTVLFSLLAAEAEEEKVEEEKDADRAIKLNITGNAQQAFGGLIAALEEVSSEDFDVSGFMGNFLQAIGNTLQVLGGLVELEIEDLKDYLEETGQVEQPSDLSDGVIFDVLQEYHGSAPVPEASELSDGIIFDEVQEYTGRLPEEETVELTDEMEDHNENILSTQSNEEILNEIEYLFGRIPDYEPIEMQDETIPSHQDGSISSEQGGPSDLSDGVIFDVLQQYEEETETNPLVKEYEELALLLKYSGSWIQAGGSIVSVYSEQKELFKGDAEQKEEEKQELEENKNPRRRNRKKKSTENKVESNQEKSKTSKYTEIKKKS